MNRWIVPVVLVLLVAAGGPTAIRAQDATPIAGADLGELVLPPDAPAYGLTYEAWTARFAQWAHSLPTAIDPAADPTGERCGFGQAGPSSSWCKRVTKTPSSAPVPSPRGRRSCFRSLTPPAPRSSHRPSSEVTRRNCGPARRHYSRLPRSCRRSSTALPSRIWNATASNRTSSRWRCRRAIGWRSNRPSPGGGRWLLAAPRAAAGG